MNIIVRPYNPETDYPSVYSLYCDGLTFGGQYDETRDSELKLRTLITTKPEHILVALIDNVVMGTVTLFEDGRSAWLYRFAVRGPKQAVAEALYTTASNILRKLGHSQVLVYAPEGEQSLQERYAVLGFTKGNVYRAFWRNI